MKLLVLIVVMALERFWQALDRWRADRAAERFIGRMRVRLSSAVGRPIACGIIWFGLPLVLVLLMSFLGTGLWSALAYTFVSIGVMLLLLAPRQMHLHVEDLHEACAQDDEDAAQKCRAQLAEGTALNPEQASTQQLAERIIVVGFHEWFVVLFWFVLAGPAGALFYRLTDWLANPPVCDSAEQRWYAKVQALLDWPVVRIYAVLLLLAGGFNRGLDAWLNGAETGVSTLAQENSALVGRVGHAALELEREDECDTAAQCLADQSRWYKGAAAIVLRALLLGLGLVALFTLSGWIR